MVVGGVEKCHHFINLFLNIFKQTTHSISLRINCACGMLVCETSGMTHEVGVVCTGVFDSREDGVTGDMCALFGVLEE